LIKFFCRESGFDCDYIIEGETEDEILSVGAEHVIQVHGLKAEDIHFEDIACNFLCQTMSKLKNGSENAMLTS